MKHQNGCKVHRINDQMMCSKCGLNWDYNDPDPPICRSITRPLVVNTSTGFNEGGIYRESNKISTNSTKAR